MGGRRHLTTWPTVIEVAALGGVSPNAVHGWLYRNGRRNYDYKKIKGETRVKPEVADAYLNRGGIPTGEPGPGCVELTVFRDEHGLPYNRLWRWCQTGRARCVRYKRRLYGNRYDFIDLMRNDVPLGWVRAQDAANELGISRNALLKRLRRRGAPIRVNSSHYAIVRQADVATLRITAPRDVVPAREVAREAGVTREAVTAWMRRRKYPVYLMQTKRGPIAVVKEEHARRYLAARRHIAA